MPESNLSEPELTDKPQAEADFSKARQMLVDLIGLPDLQKVFDDQDSETRRVYSMAPTLLLLVLQRLGGGLTLNAAVQELLKHHRDILPNNRRVEDGTLSENNSAYNKARQKLPLQKVETFSNAVCNHLAANSEAAWQGRRVVILDGTTITLPPTHALKKAFPPASNQHGKSVWPVAMLLVASEMATGCVLVPEVGAMYGENNTSEAKLAERIIDKLPNDALVLADSGFGIFQTAWQCAKRRKEFTLRLTAARFHSLKKSATLVKGKSGASTWYLKWKPSAKDRKQVLDLPKDATIEVFVHEIELEGDKDLYLVSNVEADASSLGQLYLRRYDVEFDIRDLKVTMDTENIRAKKLDTVMKELLGSVVAYNLIAQFRKQAATVAKVTPRRLSFSGVWLSFRHHLLYAPEQTFAQWQETYTAALKSAAARKLPNRSKPRAYPRMAHPRRQKSTSFQKQNAKMKAKEKDENQCPTKPK